MLKAPTLVWLILLVTAIFIAGLAWHSIARNHISNKEHDAYLAHITILGLNSSSKGALPVIKFELTGTQPIPQQVMALDVVDPKTANSIDITKSIHFGLNEIDFNVDAAKAVPKGFYDLRVIYWIPNGTLADTEVAALSDSFEIK